MALSSLLCIVHFTSITCTDQVMGSVGKHGFMWSWFIKFSIWFLVGSVLYVLIIQAELSWRILFCTKKANYYIAFIILSEALEDPSFHLSWTSIVSTILEYFYVGLLLTCFILSLGNRPQGSKWGYTLAMIGFALITIYMTVCPIATLNRPFSFTALVTHLFL